MERLTERFDDGILKGILVKEKYGEHVPKTLFEEVGEGYLGMCVLKAYEDTGLDPEQIRELKEPILKLRERFGDALTVNQVVDFFVDFYIAQGDTDRVEEAVLLTNEAASKYKELKERDTAKAPEPAPLGMEGMVCPTCGCKAVPWAKFCDECGQKFVED